MQFYVNSGTVPFDPFISQGGFEDGNTVVYDATTQSFTLKIPNGQASVDAKFTPADIVTTPAVQANVYNNGSVLFIMSKPGAEGLGLDYVAYGSWNVPGVNFAVGYMVFGIRTPAKDVPNKGTASYTGTAGGQLIAEGIQYGISGTASLTADFKTGTVDGQLSGMQKTNASGTTAWRDISMTALITGNTFAGLARSGDSSLTGTASGAFFGPGAAEIGGAWAVNGTTEHAVGNFLGKRP